MEWSELNDKSFNKYYVHSGIAFYLLVNPNFVFESLRSPREKRLLVNVYVSMYRGTSTQCKCRNIATLKAM